MIIRKAMFKDADYIVKLLNQLDYRGTEHFITEKLKKLFDDDNEIILIAEENNVAVGFMAIHFIPQIALKGDIARISYFCVDENYRGRGLGAVMEKECAKIAIERGCDRIEVHCHLRRIDAHRFYLKQGFIEVPKYFVKHV